MEHHQWDFRKHDNQEKQNKTKRTRCLVITLELEFLFQLLYSFFYSQEYELRNLDIEKQNI